MLLLCYGSLPALADVLIMMNGDRLSGTINSIQDGAVAFDSQHAGRVVVHISEIMHLETEYPAAIRPASGDEKDRGTVVSLATGVRYAFNERWSATVLVDMQNETRPQEGRENTDVTYSLGVGVSF
jgi:hypothetical protein